MSFATVFSGQKIRIETALEPIVSRALLIDPKTIVAVSRDPDDDEILSCAIEAKVDLIVTGDNDLLHLGAIENIPIVTPRQFLDRLTEDR